jgi:hypothetical protein
MQIELLARFVKQPIIINQLQLSITNTRMMDAALNVNMEIDASIDRDGSILDYCRLKEITIQPWSPLQYGFFEGAFLSESLIGQSLLRGRQSLPGWQRQAPSLSKAGACFRSRRYRRGVSVKACRPEPHAASVRAQYRVGDAAVREYQHIRLMGKDLASHGHRGLRSGGKLGKWQIRLGLRGDRRGVHDQPTPAHRLQGKVKEETIFFAHAPKPKPGNEP